ncbi:MAG TPA: Stk1 family PASTA domain-containing Ser/Thr kinase [Acidimicrobiia bacterium]|nr:Stk1 family PASTA domain-containing Ser/Thr kinase [Acidimicrobiia bacterium]
MPDEPRVYSNRYEVVRIIARGGMSEVYLAHDRHLDRPVAIKVLSSELSRDPSFVERFRREAQAAANLNHPNIVPVYDWGHEGGTYFIVMEYVNGESLSNLLVTRGRLGPDQAAVIAADVAAGLAFAHKAGVVHRDVKPGNVLITRGGEVRLTDFGVARAGPDDALTQTGSVMGTATYFSPEQAQGQPVDGRSDVYSLGVVLYEMVTGTAPFTGDNPVSVAYQHVREPVQPPRMRDADIPRPLDDIIMTALCKDPAARYRRIDDLRADLLRFRRGRAIQGVPVPVIVGATTATTAPATTVARSAITPQTVDPDTPSRSPWAIAGVAGLIILILGAIGILVARDFDSTQGGSATVEVPNVVALDIEEASRILVDEGFEVDVDLVNNNLLPEGTVANQTPVAGTMFKQGDTVTLGVSNGPGEAVVPEVEGKDVPTATALLEGAGFRVATREEANSDVEAGLIIRAVPGQGTSQRKNSQVTLVVSTGAPEVTVPDIIGLDAASASNRLGREGFDVDVRQEANSTVPRDRVISTSPGPNARASEGSIVIMVVSSGLGRVEVPGVIGDTQSSAEQRISAAGLSPSVVHVPSSPADTGIVTGQSPGSGTLVERGSPVTIEVGDGLGSSG